MKKILFVLPLFLILLAACDPIVDGCSPDPNIDSKDLKFEVVAKSQGNNNLTIVPSPARYVKVYDAATNAKIAEGTMPMYQAMPPARTFSVYVTAINPDGSVVKSEPVSIQLTNFTDIPKIIDDVFGDGKGGYIDKTWVWNTEASDGVWGNGGYLGNTGPGWWIVSAAGIDEQAVAKGLPNDGLNGWMTLGLSGVTTSRGETGTVTATPDIKQEGWDVGTLIFKGTIPLLGIQPNQGNARQYEYHILKITDTELRLCAPEPGAGAWGTAWFWNFKKKQPL